MVSSSLSDEDMENLLAHGAGPQSTGIDIQVPRGWSTLRPAVKVRVAPVGQGPGSGHMGMDQILSFDWAVSVDGEELSGPEMVDLLSTAKTVVELHGRYVRLDTRSLGVARSYFTRLRAAERSDSEPGHGLSPATRVRTVRTDSVVRRTPVVTCDWWISWSRSRRPPPNGNRWTPAT